MTWVFVGSHGIRAGWRLLIFLILTALSGLLLVALASAALHVAGQRSEVAVRVLGGTPSPSVVIASSGLVFGATLIAASIMARIEQRSVGQYGLPLASGAGRGFGEGCVVGFAALSLTLLAMYAVAGFHIDGLRESGARLIADAFSWAAAFILVALSEEFLFRGYALFTLTSGTRFGFAAAVSSIAFGLLHATNHGETPQGVLTVMVFALVLCGALWRSGTLWFGVGFHAAWDWGQTYFYGTPDSGLAASHALLAATARGPAWLSGSTAGPEGSVFTLAALGLVAVYVRSRFTGRRYGANAGC